MSSSDNTILVHNAESKRQTRRAWWLASGALVAVLGVAVGVLLFFDVPPVDDSSLAPSAELPASIPNPLGEFLATVPAALQTDFLKLPEESRKLVPGHEGSIQTFLDEQASTLDSLDKLLSTDPVVWRWPGVRDPATLNSAWTNTHVFPFLAKFLDLRSSLRQQDGNAVGALDDCLRIYQLAAGLARTDGEVEFQIIPNRMLSSANSVLERVIVAHEYGPEHLKNFQNKLTELTIRPTDLIQGIKLEHQRFKQVVQIPRVRNADWAWCLSTRPLERALAPHLYKPNMTVATRQAFILPIVQNLELGWHSAYQAAKDSEAEVTRIHRNPLREWFNPNLGGYELVKGSIGSTFISIRNGTYSAALHQVTILQLALRRHQLETGTLPTKLSQLVPKYLPEVPLDPLDGLPLRWNARNQAIYSVGQNTLDDGGKVNRPGKFYSTDLGQYYWWSEAARKSRDDR